MYIYHFNKVKNKTVFQNDKIFYISNKVKNKTAFQNIKYSIF